MVSWWNLILNVFTQKLGFPFRCRRVHISEKTLQCLNGEFEVEPAFGEKREETLRIAGLKTYFIKKVLIPVSWTMKFYLLNQIQFEFIQFSREFVTFFFGIANNKMIWYSHAISKKNLHIFLSSLLKRMRWKMESKNRTLRFKSKTMAHRRHLRMKSQR